jgi:hypothetical protein
LILTLYLKISSVFGSGFGDRLGGGGIRSGRHLIERRVEVEWFLNTQENALGELTRCSRLDWRYRK